MKQLKCILEGNVQGVFLRDFIKKNADSSGLVGIVRNMIDGTVLVVVQGEEDVLKEFLEKLKTGTDSAKVENVQMEWDEINHPFKDFKIIN